MPSVTPVREPTPLQGVVAASRGVPTSLDRVALAMLGVSFAVSLVLVGPLVAPPLVPPMVLLTLAAAARRWRLARRPGGLRPAWGFWADLALSLALVSISPVYGFYAFLGYIEAPSLGDRRATYAALAATAAVVAFAQMGGPASPFGSWGIYGLFLAVNVVIATVIGVMERQRDASVTAMARALADLHAAHESNAVLQARLVDRAREAGVAQERARLSREIHDTVAQSLVGIIAQLEAIGADGRESSRRLDAAEAAARDALGEARRAVRALASPRLDEASLPGAVTQLARDVTERTGLAVTVGLDGVPEPWRGEADLLRITQEALTNAARHSGASTVAVTLAYLGDELRLDVVDDGAGFDTDAVARGYGLAGIRERVAGLGGTVGIESAPGDGCAVGVAVPR